MLREGEPKGAAALELHPTVAEAVARALELTGAARPAVRLPTDQVSGGSAQHGVDVHTVGQRDQALGDEAAHDDTPPRLVGHE